MRQTPFGRPAWVCAWRTSRPGSALSSQGGGRGAAAFVPWAITSKAKQKAPKPQRPFWDCRWLRRWRIGSGSGSRYSQAFSVRTVYSGPPDF
ncbi:MAG: hypothetical protein HDR88_05915 [Bacteroides sp.]|nr:hypothetical protein [Bacteroides sp.]